MVTSSTASKPPNPVRCATSPTYSSALSWAGTGGGGAAGCNVTVALSGLAQAAPLATSSILMSLERSATAVTTLSLPFAVVTGSKVSSTLLPRLTTSLKLPSGAFSAVVSATCTVMLGVLLTPSSAVTR